MVTIAGAGPVSQRRPRHGRVLLGVIVPLVLTAAALGGIAVVRRGGDGSREPQELLVGARDLAFSSTDLRVEAGEITLAFANTDAVAHTFTIAALGVDVEAGGGEAARTTFSAEPGTYDFICTIPGHDTPGMRGVLTVTR